MMWPKWMIASFSKKKIVKLAKEEGTMVGIRNQEGRKIYIYMLQDLVIQIRFADDDPSGEVEAAATFLGLAQFNAQLEKEFKSVFVK